MIGLDASAPFIKPPSLVFPRDRERMDYATARLAICDTCSLYHLGAPGSLQVIEFDHRHHNHHTRIVKSDPTIQRLHAQFDADVIREVCHQARADGRERTRAFEFEKLGVAGYKGNAVVAEAFSSITTMTKTNANLASSATAGWQSQSFDNTTNLYLDYWFQFQFAAVNTAPANDKAIYFFAFALLDSTGSAWTGTGAATPSGSEGTLTYPNVSTIGCAAPAFPPAPYLVQNVAFNTPNMSYAATGGFQGMVPQKLAIGMVNFCGMTLSITNILAVGVYFTVV